MNSEHDESPVSAVQWLQVTARSKRLPGLTQFNNNKWE